MSLDLLYFSGGPRHRILRAVLDAGHHIEHVFVNDPVKWPKVVPTISLASDRGIPLSVVRSKLELLDLIDQVSGRVCLSAGFNFLFPASFLASVSACLNVHGSLLPCYAGARTLTWAIEKGESRSGVTVHLVDEGMDTGPIIMQWEFPLSPFETGRSLARKTGDLEPYVVLQALERFEQQGHASAIPQNTESSAVLPNRVPEHSRVDPNLPLIDLVDKIRAADPDNYPAYFFLHGQRVAVRLWRPDKPADEDDLI